MTNTQRLQMEIKGITLTSEEQDIYLQEVGLNPTDNYNPQSNTNKRNILKAALAILESIANNPEYMKNYKEDDISITQFHDNLLNRIRMLEDKIRTIPDDQNTFVDGARVFYFFSK